MDIKFALLLSSRRLALEATAKNGFVDGAIHSPAHVTHCLDERPEQMQMQLCLMEQAGVVESDPHSGTK